MCGFAGYLSTNSVNVIDILQQMADTIIHRGPNDSGVWFDSISGIALAHRRLSIVDLSPQGHQPMKSACERYVMVFNGEIYNHNQLRTELKQTIWRGHSDTEVILAAIAAWGIETALTKFVGMFAIALWDCEEKVLTLARDRIGEKPLYYGFQNDTFMFASELKALKVHPDFLNEIDRDALCSYLRYCYIPAPYSIYKGINKLLPGSYLQLALNEKNKTVTPKHYWTLAQVIKNGSATPFMGSDAEAITALDMQLKQSIGLQMLADVPLGAFLSGGVDSSTIVALMQVQSSRPVKTFSIGFDNASYNEAHYAKAVAQHLGTEHHELYISSNDAIHVIPTLGTIYDEPFADSSQIPTFLVAQMARQQVTVALSGDGGDELFCGYNRYIWIKRLWHKISWLPLSTRRLFAKAIRLLPPRYWQALYAVLAHHLPSRFHATLIGDKLHKLAERLINVENDDALFYSLLSVWQHPADLMLNATEPQTILTNIQQWQPLLPNIIERMMCLDTLTYLPDDILVKVDRAAMAVSLETRVPFLDYRIVEFAWQLPLTMKYRQGQSKWLLRQVLYQYVPKHLIERPKMGFGLPIGQWLRYELRDWAESLLDETRLNNEGYFQTQIVRNRWQEHLSGQRNWDHSLWIILMFQEWLEKNKC
ncbi:MAG: asparagine synthase (glutamine-hydrolyzing) [Methylococcaceae bacterium]